MGGDSVCMCEMCTVCGKAYVCVEGSWLREVSKAMVESCQFREVPSQGIVIRGRYAHAYVCLCLRVYVCVRNVF